MKRFALVAVASAASVFVAACGGGGGGGGGSSGLESPQDNSSAPTPEPTPEPTYATGQWEGFISPDAPDSRKVEGFVLEDGSYYVFYSQAGKHSVLSGFIQGKGVSDYGKFTSQEAVNFNVDGDARGAAPVSATATYVAKKSLAGSVTYADGTSSPFSTLYDALFEKTPTLTAFAGEYPGSLVSTLGVEDVTLTVRSTGDISAITTSGCALTGAGTPRAEGNVFDVWLKFDGAPCLFADKKLEGMAYLHPTKRLYLAVSEADKSGGLLFFTKKTQ